MQPFDVSDDYRDYEIHHRNWSKDYQEDQQQHRDCSWESSCSSTSRIVPEIIELKLSKDHDKDLDEGAGWVVKGLCLIVEMDDEEGESKRADEDGEAKRGPDDPLCDWIVHDGEHAPDKRVASEEEDQFDPGKADTNSRYNLKDEHIIVFCL